MKQKNKALYAGSFDPVTLGHLKIVEQTLAQGFDELVILIAKNEAKTPDLDENTRITLFRQAISEAFSKDICERITVISSNKLTVDVAIEYGVSTLIRGIRPGTRDEANEKALAKVNLTLAQTRGFNLATKFIRITDPFLQTVSSTSAKALFKRGEFIAAYAYVPPAVRRAYAIGYLKNIFSPLFAAKEVFIKSEEEDAFNKFIEVYQNRPYHNLIHLAYMFNMLEISNISPERKSDLILAIFYHDFVYDTARTDNEAASAAAAYGCYGEHLYVMTGINFDNVQNLIMTTTHNQNNLTGDMALIADLDLSILGTFNKNAWLDYNNAIRKEYAAYSDQEYCPARIAVLQSFLDRPRIFHTDFFHNRFEAKARENIITQIYALTQML